MVYQRVVLLCISLVILTSKAFATEDSTQRAVWVNEAIVSTYTYTYQNFLSRQKEIAAFYTAKGWIAYSNALNASKLPETVQKNNYSVSAVATMPPQIQEIRNGYWQAVMPLLVVYKNPQYQQKQNLEVTLQFVAAPAGQGVRGYAVTSIQSVQKGPVCPCPAEQKK